MNREDWQRLILAGNDIAMQWYALTHGQAVPGAPGSVVVTQPAGGGLSATFGSGAILMGVVAIVGLVWILKD